ncbi:hypothetical protein RCL1_005627 [Eukaryota sp. TZLM3-RCL]
MKRRSGSASRPRPSSPRVIDLPTLPVHSYKDQILSVIRSNQVCLVVGATGSGKTTQIPQFLLQGFQSNYLETTTTTPCIMVTQPRRVAAQSIASRVADELNTTLGKKVGYNVRFRDVTSAQTQIIFATDGILLREMASDPLLSRYSAVMLDEVHERSINTDLLISLCKICLTGRPDLRLIVSSATMEAQFISKYFDSAPVQVIPGSPFKVEVFYTKAAVSDYIDAAARTILDIITNDQYPSQGDLLVFLTGQDDIEDCISLVESRLDLLPSTAPVLSLLPLYSALPPEQQDLVFKPTREGTRKIVFATNIAETSVTIPGVKFVIDCGYCKQKVFNPNTGSSSLSVTPISRASALQRQGRAGRVSEGFCFRLYSKWVFEHELEESTAPEIQRSELDSMVLTLMSMGVVDLVNYPFLQRPPLNSLVKALDNLYALGLVDSSGKVSGMGKKASMLPLDPRFAVCLINSVNYSALREIIMLISVLSSPPIQFLRKKSTDGATNRRPMGLKCFKHTSGDHLAIIKAFKAFLDNNKSNYWARERGLHYKHLVKAVEVYDQLLRLVQDIGLFVNESEPSDDSILKSLLTGLFQSVAVRKCYLEGYKTLLNNQTVRIHPSSLISISDPNADAIVYTEMIQNDDVFYLRQVSIIDPSWVLTIAPHVYGESFQELLKVEKDEDS